MGFFYPDKPSSVWGNCLVLVSDVTWMVSVLCCVFPVKSVRAWSDQWNYLIFVCYLTVILSGLCRQ